MKFKQDPLKCKYGHPRNEKNKRVNKRGLVICRSCQNESNARRRERDVVAHARSLAAFNAMMAQKEFQ